MKAATDAVVVAPCGMNCALCAGYLSFKNDLHSKGVKVISCTGCRPSNKKCAFLKKVCSKLSRGELTFCYECSNFPCERLRTTDDRYRAHYRMNMIDNLNFIKENGMAKFIESQKKIWKCPDCGELISCHNGLCFKCDFEQLKERNQKYRCDEDHASK